ncbi:MAG: glycosyl hydrolase family 8 [Treponemataceae bacterium]|nr:glycosyl hydrolase family 8 [Treponemataceae bacterium]
MRNLLAELGYSQKEIDERINTVWNTIFDQSSDSKFYHQQTKDSGCMEDTGNIDARTEGMSYGMMMAVQMNRKDIFDSLWKWSKENMFLTSGEMKGYFAWSCNLKGQKNFESPAPDGEEFYAMSLFFAAKRWGNGENIFNYEKEAKEILHTCLTHKKPMWNKDNALILFVPACPYTDPSYHLPHFYTLFAEYDSENSEFWKRAANASRKYLEISCNKNTGLSAEYAHFDGSPVLDCPWGDHGFFYSDSYRTAANIGLDALWNGSADCLTDRIIAIQNFFKNIAPCDYGIYKIDGTQVEGSALHPVALLATLAQSSLAVFANKDANPKALENAKHFVNLFWHTPLRTGKRRYYDNCLYLFALLALSGNYKPY